MSKDVNLKKIWLIAVCAVITASFVLVGCGTGGKKYVGEYEGSGGSFLKLSKDGTCVYSDGSWKEAEKGTWIAKDGEIIVDIDRLGYEIYADMDDDDGLLFTCEEKGYFVNRHGSLSHWNDEYFSKQ